jgi:hypothetical protein
MHQEVKMGRELKSGYGIVHRCVMENQKISRDAKALYALLQSYTGASEYCWPSQARLADGLGCTERSVINWLHELEENGLLRVERETGKSNRYTPLVPDAEPVKEPSRVTEGSPEPVNGGSLPREPGFTLRVTSKTNTEEQHSSPAKKTPSLKTDHVKRREASGHFYALYAKKRDGAKPAWSVVEERLLDADLQRVGPDRLKAAMTLYVENPPPTVAQFCAKAGIEYRVFHSQIDKLLAAERDPATKARAENTEFDLLLKGAQEERIHNLKGVQTA